ncbi:MAG: ATP-binding cassette domain-containing protein [Desulfurococcales archaeon]|nr:ATP-binding cassette domain-containing protein [Desulfurococcales archaeon]
MAIRVEARNVVKRYPRFTLTVERLTAETGIHVLVGPNGSGKTVLLRLLAGVARPSQGRIEYVIDGERLGADRVTGMVGLVGSGVSLPNWPVARLISYFLDIPLGEAARLAREYVLEGYEWKKYEELSSGYKRRVQVAIALERRSKILLLDEPFINVDSEYIGFLEEHLIRMAGEKLIVVATHVPSRLLEHNLILIRDGQIVFTGRIPNLLEEIVTVEADREVSLHEVLNRCGVRGRIRITPLQEALFRLASRYGGAAAGEAGR